ncbi:hypothetical protein FA95DRAFT_1557829 [Auriscalpium vulgare]|uniref:Uncharacterized protein n=1 Tax=Auriscalpium vulgare TaxID=40419 RepID=A0ACB8RYJ8_9AGAM|nr:hypothetical protein FA95DRAFT_1557829 [Auriscalpium vulgare]
MGNYKLQKSERPLAAEEFKALHEQSRQQWADVILKAQPWHCYTSMRARIWLRKNGLAITEEAIEKVRRPKTAGKDMGLVPRDALMALDSGEEVLDVMSCTPVSYDADFQAALVVAYLRWEQEEVNFEDVQPALRVATVKKEDSEGSEWLNE